MYKNIDESHYFVMSILLYVMFSKKILNVISEGKDWDMRGNGYMVKEKDGGKWNTGDFLWRFMTPADFVNDSKLKKGFVTSWFHTKDVKISTNCIVNKDLE